MQVARRDLRVRQVGVVVIKDDHVLDSESVEVAEGDIMSPRSDTVRLVRGDTVFVIKYLALGRWTWAHRGRLHDSDEFWAAAPVPGLGGAGTDSSVAVARSTPETEDWWYVQPRKGAPGWWRGDDRSELQSVSYMERWGDDCAQVAKRASTPGETTR